MGRVTSPGANHLKLCQGCFNGTATVQFVIKQDDDSGPDANLQLFAEIFPEGNEGDTTGPIPMDVGDPQDFGSGYVLYQGQLSES